MPSSEQPGGVTHTHILLGYNGGFLVLAVFQVCFPPSPLQMNLMHVVVGAYVEFVLSSGWLHNTCYVFLSMSSVLMLSVSG